MFIDSYGSGHLIIILDIMSKIIQRKEVSLTEDDTLWKESFYFIQAADCQFGMIDNFVKKLPDPKWDEEIELSKRVVAACNIMRPKPKFMVICGDLVDAFPGKRNRDEQVKDFKRIFSMLDPDIPLVCVCGNHDIGNRPTLESLEEYKREFGDDYFFYTLNGVLFIVINSQFYEHRTNLVDYAAEQDRWLESILDKCSSFKYTFLFQHIPWFLEDPDEEHEYFNIDKECRLHWLRKFRDAGVTKVMCGHYHKNAGGWFGPMELVVTSAIGASLGDDKSGIRVVTVGDKQVDHKYYEIDDIPQKVNLEG